MRRRVERRGGHGLRGRRRPTPAAGASEGAGGGGTAPGEGHDEGLPHPRPSGVGEAHGSPEPAVGEPDESSRRSGEQPPVEPPPDTLLRLLTAAGALLGSTTVLTALLFYFGRMHITGFFRYLRVNFTTLDFTLYDHLIRSADGLFLPLTVAGAVGILALWVSRSVMARRGDEDGRSTPRLLVLTAVALGVLCVGVAVIDLLNGAPVVIGRPWVGGVALSGGVVLLAYSVHLARMGRPVTVSRSRPAMDLAPLAEGACAFLLVSVGLFWAIGNYAIEVGTGRAHQQVADLPRTADAVLYSEQSLRLAVAGVTEVRCLDPEAAYRFRYDGLKLVLQSGDQYLFLPSGWTRENGTAVLLPRSDSIRLDFAPPGQQRQPVC